MESSSTGLYYIGVDGGGTRSRARLVTAKGVVLGQATSGPGNIRLGLEPVWQNIMAAVDEAIVSAGIHLTLTDIQIGLGLAGVTSPASAQLAIEAAPRFRSIHIASDAHAACLGAFAGQDGAILICGTGSAGYIISKGKGAGVGGWGFEIGDDASASGLGRAAIRAAIRSYDGIGPSSDFTTDILTTLGGQPTDVIAFASTATPRAYGALAPKILDYAHQGDLIAQTLVKSVAADIGLYIKRLQNLGAPQIALVGGLADPILPWLDKDDAKSLTHPLGDAVDGALIMAMTESSGFTQPAPLHI